MIGGVCPPDHGNGFDLGTAVYLRAADGTWSSRRVDALMPRLGSGDWENGLAVVGLPNERGAAHVMGQGGVSADRFGAGGSATLPDGSGGSLAAQGDGYEVDLDQGVLAIASHAPNVPVVVRRRVGDTVLPEAALIALDLGAEAPVQAVAARGDLIAFGAHRHTVSQAGQGAVYLFRREKGQGTQRRKLLSPAPAPGDAFGGVVPWGDDGPLFVAAACESDPFESHGRVHVLAPPTALLFADGFE